MNNSFDHPRTRSPRYLGLICLLAVGLLGGCAASETGEDASNATPEDGASSTPEDGASSTTGDGDTSTSKDDSTTSPGEALIPSLEPGWNELIPAGDTVCSRGSEYAFFVHNGTTNKVVIEFEGGGACWTDGTCSVADAIFKDSVEDDRLAYAAGYMPGILNHDKEENPFKDWHHIFVPYCTGDVHIGDAVHTYGKDDKTFTINHKGAVNVGAVMDWAKENLPDPETVFITGCSAGAYGSIFWAPHILEQYPDAKVYQMGDSGCGVITQSFLDDSFPIWNGTAILPTWIDSLHPDTIDIGNTTLQDIYTHVAAHYSTQLFSQYTTVEDNNQVFYFEAMGGSGTEEWTEQMLSSLAGIADKSPNFRRFIAPGDRHCILPHEEVWTLEVEGIKFMDWVLNMVSGIPIDEVICAECGGQE